MKIHPVVLKSLDKLRPEAILLYEFANFMQVAHQVCLQANLFAVANSQLRGKALAEWFTEGPDTKFAGLGSENDIKAILINALLLKRMFAGSITDSTIQLIRIKLDSHLLPTSPDAFIPMLLHTVIEKELPVFCEISKP